MKNKHNIQQQTTTTELQALDLGQVHHFFLVLIYSNKRQPLNYRLLTWDRYTTFSWSSFLSRQLFFYLQTFYEGGINIPVFKHQTYWLPELQTHQTRYFITEKQAKYALNFRIRLHIFVLLRTVSQYVYYKDHKCFAFHLIP